MFFPVVVFISSIVLMFALATTCINVITRLSNNLHIPLFLLSLTFVSFVTSLPDILVSYSSVKVGLVDAGIMNIIGSNIANYALSIGIVTLLFKNVDLGDKTLVFISNVLLIITMIFIGYVFFGYLPYVWRFWLLFIFSILSFGLISYIVYITYRLSKMNQSQDFIAVKEPAHMLLFYVVIAITAMLGISFASDVFVESGLIIAHSLGFTNDITGKTIFAVGTSMPEFTIACIAAYRRQVAFIVADVLGSNICNLFFGGLLTIPYIDGLSIISGFTVGGILTLWSGLAFLAVFTFLFHFIYLRYNYVHQYAALLMIAFYIAFLYVH